MNRQTPVHRYVPIRDVAPPNVTLPDRWRGQKPYVLSIDWDAGVAVLLDTIPVALLEIEEPAPAAARAIIKGWLDNRQHDGR